MAKITYDPNDQINELAIKLATAEKESTKWAAIYKAMDKRINELEAKLKELEGEQKPHPVKGGEKK